MYIGGCCDGAEATAICDVADSSLIKRKMCKTESCNTMDPR